MILAHLSKSSFNQYPEYNCLNLMHSLVIFYSSVVGYLPSSTQSNIVANDYLLAWLLRIFKINLSVVGIEIHSPPRNVVMDISFLEEDSHPLSLCKVAVFQIVL